MVLWAPMSRSRSEVYLNGTLVARTSGYATDSVLVPVREPGVLKPGINIHAIHCTQTRGGQHNDAGLVDIIPQPREAGSNWS